MISHIVAASENNIIGYKNELPWHLPNDFKYFKNTTWALPIIMGRQTFEALKKALPGRSNIVLTRDTSWQAPDVEVAHSIEDAIQLAKKNDTKEIFIIGGGEIFRQTLPLADRVYLTRVHASPEGDTRYPELDPAEWQKTKSTPFEADDKNQYAHTFEIWERINTNA